MASYLFEHIDRLLLRESPESLGFPESVANSIRDRIEHRKAQDYVARWFKDMKHGLSNALVNAYLRDVFKQFRIQELKKVAQKMGIRWDKELEPKSEASGWVSSKEEKEFRKDLERRIEYKVMLTKGVDDLLDFRKRVHKALKNEGVKYRMDQALGAIDAMIASSLDKQIIRHYTDLVEFLNSDPNAWRKVKGAKDVEDAADVAAEELDSMSFDESHIVHEFPDGYYWYDVVNPQECRYEKNAMQHCGEPSMNGSKMYSLRDENNKPHMTVEYNKRENVIPQIRGKQNEVPKERYWKYLDALFSKVIKTRPMFTDDGMMGPGRLITGLEEYIDSIRGAIYWNGAEKENISIANVIRDMVEGRGGPGLLAGNRNIEVQGVWSDHQDHGLTPSMMVAYFISADEIGIEPEELNRLKTISAIQKYLNGFSSKKLLDGLGWQGQDSEVHLARERKGTLKIVMDFHMNGEALHGQEHAQDTLKDTELILDEAGRQIMIANVRKALQKAGVIEESASLLSEGWYRPTERVPDVHPTAFHGSDADGIKRLRWVDPKYRGGIGGGVYVSYYKNVAEFYGKHLYEVRLKFPKSKVFVIDNVAVMRPRYLRGYSLLGGENLESFSFEAGGKAYLVTKPHWEDRAKEAHRVSYLAQNWWSTDIPVEAMEALDMADEDDDYAFREFPDLDEMMPTLAEGMRPLVMYEWEERGGDPDIDFNNPPDEYINLEIEMVSEVIEQIQALADKADKHFEDEYDEIIDLEEVGGVIEDAGYKAVWFVGMRGGWAEVNTEVLVFDDNDVELVRQLK